MKSAFKRLESTLKSLGVSSDPIIVLGMHRSGTTILVKILQSAGVFMGGRLSGNREPRLIQDANRQIFDYFNASWLDAHLVPTPDILQTGYTGLATGIANRFSEDFGYAFFENAQMEHCDWGFKDPRTAVTAGLFLRFFPNARAIFIFRDPLAVALSIVAREKKIRRKRPGMGMFEYSHDEFQALMMRSVKVWEIYNKRALQILPFFQHVSVLRYESLVQDPVGMIGPALSAVGISISKEQIEKSNIYSTRASVAHTDNADFSMLNNYLSSSGMMDELCKYVD